MLLLPLAALVLPLLAVSWAGGFDDFAWINKPVTFWQSFGTLSAMFFPFGAFLFARCGWNAASARLSRSWPIAPGRVIENDIKERTVALPLPMTVYRLALTYRYEIDGREIEGDTVQFGPKWVPEPRVVQDLSAKYPKGAAVSVHYKSDDPDICVLDTGDDMAWQDKLRIGSLFVLSPAISAFIALVNAMP